MKTQDDGTSFIQYMVGNGAGLTVYANLIYAGLAKKPVKGAKLSKFMADLLPFVSRCALCEDPMQPEGVGCQGCRELHYELRLRTMKALDANRDRGFHCLEVCEDPHRRPRRYELELDEEVA